MVPNGKAVIPSINKNENGGAFSTVALAFRNTACRYAKRDVHECPQHDLISGFGPRRFNRNAPIHVDPGMHEQVDRGDHAAILPERAVDIVKTVWVPVSVLIKEIIHLRAAAWMKEIVFAHIV